ncbi:MAG: hypothetical protein KKI08_27440 [Armatimonadetes bacterium]|nr:hypothetical protein [Armatimonadota bacterium]
MLRHATTKLLALLLTACCSAAPAAQLIVHRELVKGQPQGVARVFDAPPLLLVRATFDQPLPNSLIALKLVRNTTSVLNSPFDLKGDTRRFDLRLRTPDGKPFQPGVYKFTISQGGKVVAETAFLVGKILPPPPPRVYYGPPLPEGADPFAAAGTPPKLEPLVVFRKAGDSQTPEVKEQFAPTDQIYVRLTLGAPLTAGRGHLKLVRDGQVMSEGDLELKSKTVFDLRLVTEVGFPPGKYALTITTGDRILGEASFVVVAPAP